MENCYLVVCSGQGDIEIKIIDQETWDWIWSDRPNESVSLKDDLKNYPGVLNRLIEEMKNNKYIHDVDEELERITISSSGTDNDRALSAPPTHGKTFYDIVEAMKYINTHNINIINEYKGLIY